MARTRCSFSLFLVVSILGIGAVGQAAAQQGPPPFRYTIDAAVRPSISYLARRSRGPVRPAGALFEPGVGKQTFVIGEIVFYPRSSSDLKRFLQRFGGTVVDDGFIPPLPSSVGDTSQEEVENVGFVTVRIDPSRANLGRFQHHAARAGARGLFRFSSLAAAQTVAAIAEERAFGARIGINAVLAPARATKPELFTSTFEHPVASSAPDHLLPNLGFKDGFQMNWLNDPDIRVAEAWQYLASLGKARPSVYVAIIDGGFAFNADFGSEYLQKDFAKEDDDASGTNPGDCGDPCPWHATGAFSVAAAAVNNRFGAAGTGGQVAIPMLFRVDYSFGQAAKAVKTAVEWSKEGGRPLIINMSFSGSCGFWCSEEGLNDALGDAEDAGAIAFASAGNDNQDAGDKRISPCKYGSVICVGSIGTDKRKAGSSNHGSAVDIWAPGVGVVTTTDPDSAGGLTSFNGTSAASPFVAGIAAMMKAANPFLDRDAILDILESTASASADPLVDPGFVNAFLALREAKGVNQPSHQFMGMGALWHDSFAFDSETPATGDFNGDGRSDVVTFLQGSDGRVFVALSVGSELVASAVWLDSFCLGGEVCRVGDFNGDGRDDIAAVDQSTGEVQVALSTGSSFAPPSLWHSSFSLRPGQTVVVGNFNFTATPSDERDDLAVFVHGNDPATLAPGESRGEVYIALSTGSAFGPRTRWHDFFAPGPEQVAAGDFDGDGRSDIVGFLRDCCPEPDRADVYVARSHGSGFLPSVKWHDFFSIDLEVPAAGDVTGDKRADAVTFVRSDTNPGNDEGDVYVTLSFGDAFDPIVDKWHDFFCILDEICHLGDMDGDGRMDVVAFTRGSKGDVFVALSSP